MDGSQFSVPLPQLINVVTLAQAVIFAGILLTDRFRQHAANLFLVAALLIMATIKGDQLFQMLGGLERYPQYGFLLAPVQALMTPVLYLFVTAKTSTDFKFEKGYLWHAAPFLMFTAYLFTIYFRLDIDQKTAMLAAGEFATPFNRLVVPLIGDAIQLGYVIAALQRLGRFGVSLRNWFSHVEDRDLRWLKRLIAIWGAVFVFHAAFAISAGAFGAIPFARTVLTGLDVIHLAMVNGLMLMGVTAQQRTPDNAPAIETTKVKYAASTLTAAERSSLFKRALEKMKAEALYLRPELTLKTLAETLSATPRELSEAINGVGGQNFFDFVNSARIEHAKGVLVREPEARILDIAFQSGFKSKTAFNEAFKKNTGETPSAYRRHNASSPATGQNAENPA